MFMKTYTWNILSQVFSPNGMGFGGRIDTTLQVNLMNNDYFKEEVIDRYVKYISTFFTPERLLPIYDAMIAEIKSEMPRQLERWPKPEDYLPWEDHVAIMRQIIIEKPEIEKHHLQLFFGLSDAQMQELFP